MSQGHCPPWGRNVPPLLSVHRQQPGQLGRNCRRAGTGLSALWDSESAAGLTALALAQSCSIECALRALDRRKMSGCLQATLSAPLLAARERRHQAAGAQQVTATGPAVEQLSLILL